ncbi:MAG: DUF928 domain-containing protein [Chlorogloeopsis fritschii C42_A2020_084]|uniref:DUF928 domain-containing protein n=1 Tax=Chlorogloeopsis fritschii TaxID=1124 RepID=UPI0019F951B6|nr:DUF928 domain-containing protein [Chlorogloeopsis fritschii]MBF2005544.1 DUF928 domain-containing protein [Chlorogloeopsis fritschii C42_A2020_084]
MKFLIKTKRLILVSAFLVFLFFLFESAKLAAQIQNPNSNYLAQTLKFPGSKGAPKGRRRGAASRRGCPRMQPNLTALVPDDNSQGLTAIEYPTFWFYIPSLPQGNYTAEFILQNSQNQNIYHTPITLPKKSSILSVSLPSQPQYALKPKQWYRWYFKIYCDPQVKSVYVFVEGTVERVPQNAYSADSLWYDVLTNLANRLRANPQNYALKNEWTQLLKSVGLESVSHAPL